MKLIDMEEALLSIMPNVSHFFAHKQTDDYIVWYEDMQGGSTSSDNKKTGQSIQGMIHLFTKTEYSPFFDAVQSKLNGLDLSWNFEGILYEEDTKYIHYTWVFEMENEVMGVGEDRD